jgi:hypothetical protein
MGPVRRFCSLTQQFGADVLRTVTASATKSSAEMGSPSQLVCDSSPPAILVTNVGQHTLGSGYRQTAKRIVHWTFGALVGGILAANGYNRYAVNDLCRRFACILFHR